MFDSTKHKSKTKQLNKEIDMMHAQFYKARIHSKQNNFIDIKISYKEGEKTGVALIPDWGQEIDQKTRYSKQIERRKEKAEDLQCFVWCYFSVFFQCCETRVHILYL